MGKYLCFWGFQLLFISQVFAVVGTYVDTAQIPPQLCRIAPTSVVSNPKDSAYICSAVIIGDRYLLTAGHCMALPYQEGRIDCQGGETAYRFNKSQVSYRDASNIVKSTFADPETLAQDLAIITLDEAAPPFKTAPLDVVSMWDEWELHKDLQENRCLYIGVGWNNYGTFGLAHAAIVPSYSEKLLQGELLKITGDTHTQTHDSGGGMVCTSSSGKMRLVGVITGGYEKTSVMAPLYDRDNRDWVMKTLGRTRVSSLRQ